MKKQLSWILAIMLVLALALSACGGANETAAPEVEEAPAAAEPAEEMEEEPAEEPVEEPAEEAAEEPAEEVAEEVAEEPAEEMMEEAADLDSAFAAFLGDMEAYNTIGLEDVNVALLEDPPPFLLDVRQPEEAEANGHIESAVLIPLRELAQNLDQLPSFDTPIVAYCGSGWRATIAMTALEAMGWEDVKVMKGGSFGGWVEAGYPVAEGLPPEGMVLNAAEPDPAMVAEMDAMLTGIPEGWGVITADALNTELIEKPELILIDVRTTGEVEGKGSIDAPNEQVNIPIEEFVAMKDMWPAEKEAEIVVYCGSGHRSTIGMSILRSYGYTNVRSLKGGFGGWAGAGFPVVGGPVNLDEPFAAFLGDMEAYNTIGLEDVNVALLEDPPPFLLDVRQPEEAEANGHIESAVLIPLRELAQNLDQLPSFDTPIVAYCGSGWRATIAMTALEAMGWEDVKVMKGGSFGGWVEAGYPVAEGLPPEGMILNAAEPNPELVAELDAMLSSLPEGWGVVTADALNTELIENPDLFLIDVRTTGEVAEKGAIDAPNPQVNIPIEEFVAMKDMWPAEKEAEIVVYCGSGHRSTIGMSILRSYGYTNVRSLKGGFGGWAEAGFPVAQTTPPLDEAFSTFLANMEAYNTISLEDVNVALLEDPPPFLLDVRQPEEAEANGHIESAVLIPLRELAQNLDQLPSFDTPIVAYCGSGWRATIAMTALEAMGWEDVKVMKGGSFGGWVEAGYPVIEGLPADGMVLNAAEPDSALVTEMDAMLTGIPEGWGVITADTLNTELIEKPELILMDVRTDGELEEKGVIDAPNELIAIPIEEFMAMKDMWPAEKEAEIVVYCGSGHRSTIGMSILRSYGYDNVRSLKGGFNGWAEAGFPIVEYAVP